MRIGQNQSLRSFPNKQLHDKKKISNINNDYKITTIEHYFTNNFTNIL